jgi:hypothetical protein
MVNIFSEFEDEVLSDETIIFDKEKIKNRLLQLVTKKLESVEDSKKPFLFQDIVYDFFEYERVNIIKSGKTRDSGLDGVVDLNLDLIGKIKLGLQIKYKLIDSNDLDSFIASLRNAELQLGVMVCKDSRKFDKYSLNNKIKTILFSKGIKVRERLIKENIDINPVFIIRFDELLDKIAFELRGFIEGVYKK